MGFFKTAKDLLAAGYQVILIEDATTARTRKLHDRSLADLKALGVVIQTSDFSIEVV